MILRAALTALFVLGCSRASETPAPTPSSSAVPATPPPASATAALPALPPMHGAEASEPVTSCRAIQVKGKVSLASGTRIDTGTGLDRSRWVDLAPGAVLVVKHAETSREITFSGKGHVQPCVHGEERFAMTEGTVTTTAGAGAHPGGEVLLATPLGLVRYGDAQLKATLDAKGLHVAIQTGSAFFDEPNEEGVGKRLAAGDRFEAKATRPDVKTLVQQCETLAETAEQRARDVLSPKPPIAPLGQRASAHVRARQAARKTCAIAGAALGTLEMGKDRDDLESALAAADARWRGVPDGATPDAHPRPKARDE